MYKVNRIIAYICFIAAVTSVIFAFFKGKHLFFMGLLYYIIGLMFSDTYAKEKELEDK